MVFCNYLVKVITEHGKYYQDDNTTMVIDKDIHVYTLYMYILIYHLSLYPIVYFILVGLKHKHTYVQALVLSMHNIDFSMLCK